MATALAVAAVKRVKVVEAVAQGATEAIINGRQVAVFRHRARHASGGCGNLRGGGYTRG